MHKRRKFNTRRTATFVLRLVINEEGDWCGRVGHVQSGETLHFQHALQALRFIDQRLHQIAGEASEEFAEPPGVAETDLGRDA